MTRIDWSLPSDGLIDTRHIRKNREVVLVVSRNDIRIWIAKHRCFAPWATPDVYHTPQWKSFIADAAAKAPSKRSNNERKGLAIFQDIIDEKPHPTTTTTDSAG